MKYRRHFTEKNAARTIVEQFYLHNIHYYKIQCLKLPSKLCQPEILPCFALLDIFQCQIEHNYTFISGNYGLSQRKCHRIIDKFIQSPEKSVNITLGELLMKFLLSL